MSVELAQSAARVLGAARERKLTLVTAESCSAGGLAMLLSEAPGASDTLHGGFVVYTKDQKMKALGIDAELLQRHTAVCEPVAKAMAVNALERSMADLAVAITGVAGPDPDEDGNPVGLVHIALATRSGAVRHQVFNYGRLERDEILHSAKFDALRMVDQHLTELSAPSKGAIAG
jgi:nicotinamide-nucleotide amidase